MGAVWSRAPALLCSTIFREPFACQAQKQWNSGSMLSTLLPKILGRCCRLGMSLPVLREFVWLNRTLVASSGKSRGCWGEAVSWGSSDGKEDPRLAVTPRHHPLVWKALHEEAGSLPRHRAGSTIPTHPGVHSMAARIKPCAGFIQFHPDGSTSSKQGDLLGFDE